MTIRPSVLYDIIDLATERASSPWYTTPTILMGSLFVDSAEPSQNKEQQLYNAGSLARLIDW